MSHVITRLGHLGDGVADGPIYAERTLPGEVVGGTVTDGRIDAPKILQPSSHRIRPLCPAYNRCGGCGLQHADKDFVQSWKIDVVDQALAAQGVQINQLGFHTSHASTRRRAKLTGRRLKKSAVVGFLQRKSNAVTDINGCTVLVPEILGLIPMLETLTGKYGSRRGSLEFWILSTQTGIDLAIDGLPPLDADGLQQVSGMAADAGLARLTVGDETIFQAQPPVLQFHKLPVTPPPRAFVQATKQGELAIQATVGAALRDATGPIVDLFSGCGTIGGALAHAHSIHAVEGDDSLLSALQNAAHQTSGIKPITTERRDLFRHPLDVGDLAPFAAAILDPPRAGALAQVQHVANSHLGNVVMVSCNPVTFARDTAVLVAAGFEMVETTVIDQFRWSHHVEVMAHFTR